MALTFSLADIWQHPSHTWHSWRDRWLRHLSLEDDIEEDEQDPQEEEEGGEEDDEEAVSAADYLAEEPQPQQSVNGHTAEIRGLAAAETTNNPSGHAEASGTKLPAINTPGSSSTTKRAKAMSDDERLERQE